MEDKEMIKVWLEKLGEMDYSERTSLTKALIAYEMKTEDLEIEEVVDRAYAAFEEYMEVDDARMFSETIVEGFEDFWG